MKNKNHRSTALVLTFSAVLLFGVVLNSQPCAVTFQADLKGIKADNPGLRGSMEPLSWEKSIALSDPDRDGIFTATVNFTQCPTGQKVLYKFVNGNLVWENDYLGPIANRAVILTGQPQTLSIQTWDQLDDYQPEGLVEVLDWENFRYVVTALGLAKKRGVTPEQLAQEEADFWSSPDAPAGTPQQWLGFAKAYFSASPERASFKVLENTPEQVKISGKKYWSGYFENSKGAVNGVTFNEFWAYFKKVMILNANSMQLQMAFQEDGDQAVMIVTKR